MVQGPADNSPWWTVREVAAGRSAHLHLGPLYLVLGHGEGEWLLSSESGDEASHDESDCRIEVSTGLPDEPGERFVHTGGSDRVWFTPLLADRPVVIRPRQPVFLLAGQVITLYLSTPVWLKIEVSDPPVLLKELPALRLSDTWFGPSTRQGELCYAGRTHARHNLADLPERAHRAITPLEIRNDSSDPVPLEKISLPVPLLSLYGDSEGSLWTQRVSLTVSGPTAPASVRVTSDLPEVQRELQRLSGPRAEGGRSGMTRALNLLLGY